MIPFIAPMIIVSSAVLLFPLAFSVYLSFAKVTPNLTFELSGVGNYAAILEDRLVWQAVRNSVAFTVFSVSGQLLVGLAAALILDREIKAKRWFRLVLLLPWVTPTVVTSLTWRWMLDSQYGLVNDLLVRLGFLSEFQSWTGSVETALPSAILVNIWRGYPFIAIMLLAGLQLIPRDRYEAAEVDGAGATQLFRYITIPGLRYTIAIATTLSGIWAFKEFALIDVLTGGGPAGSSEVVGTLVYKMFFQFSRFGDAAALGVLILVSLMAFSIYYVRLLLKSEQDVT